MSAPAPMDRSHLLACTECHRRAPLSLSMSDTTAAWTHGAHSSPALAQIVRDAYEELSSPTLRANYDQYARVLTFLLA